jgi:signal transduction histidine kinase
MSLPRILRQLGLDSMYSLLGLPIAVVSFTLMITGISLSAGLLITLVGIPVLAATLFVARGFADLHRVTLRGVLNRDIPRPRYLRATGKGFWRRTFTPMRDGQSWLDLVAAIVDFPLAIVAFVLTVVWWSVSLSGITSVLWEWSIPHGPTDHSLAWVLNMADTHTNRLALYTVLGVLFTLTLPLVTRIAALTRGHVAGAMLFGVAELRQQIAGLEERNTDLADQKMAAVSAEANALRRLERDIHDGPQQRLVRLAMDLGRAKQQMETDPVAARATIDEALGQTRDTLDELRALSRGIAPPILTDRGLAAALAALAGRNPVPVDLAVDPELGRLDASVEVTAYFVVAEALTNVAKHSRASSCEVTVARGPDRLGVLISDDGDGGAASAKGHGLAGLADRVRANGGTLTITSPAGGPTDIRAEIPCV